MKRYPFLIIFIFFIIAEFAISDDFNFRKTKWGFNRSQVKEAETATLIQDASEHIAYKGNVANLNCLVVYHFQNNTLYMSSYQFTEEHSNRNDYINDYKKIKKLLTEKYGEPETDDVVWRNNLYKDDRQEWGLAVSIGHLVYMAKWDTPNTEIALMLRGDNYSITHFVLYKSKGLKEQIEKEQEKKELEAF